MKSYNFTLFIGQINGLLDLDSAPTEVLERFGRLKGMPSPLEKLIKECLSDDAQERPSADTV